MSSKKSNTPAKRKMPNAPLKLASAEDVARYLTTVTKMLHDDLISPQKARALKDLCMAKLVSFKENKATGVQVQINIGTPMGTPRKVTGTGKKENLIEVIDHSGDISKSIVEVNQEAFTELEKEIEEVLADGC